MSSDRGRSTPMDIGASPLPSRVHAGEGNLVLSHAIGVVEGAVGPYIPKKGYFANASVKTELDILLFLFNIKNHQRQNGCLS